MRQRCLNKKGVAWENYGGRGITVCDEWINNYDNFFQDMGECPQGMTLERIDHNGNYEKSNCKWASMKEQQNNKRNNVVIEFNGVSKTLTGWANRLSIGVDTLWRRINVYKFPIDKALTAGSLAKKWEHGTRYGYENGCKCLECKAAHAKRFRDIRAKKKLKQIS